MQDDFFSSIRNNVHEIINSLNDLAPATEYLFVALLNLKS